MNFQDLNNGKVEQYVTSLTFKEALLQMQQKDSTLLAELTNILTGSKHSAYFFETPSITKATLANKSFEFVLVEAQQLVGIKSDTDTFADYFTDCDSKPVARYVQHNNFSVFLTFSKKGRRKNATLGTFLTTFPQKTAKDLR